MKIETCPLCGKEAQLTSGSWTREAPATIECTTCGLILRNPRSIKEVIAAAPEMLEMLKKLQFPLEDCDGNPFCKICFRGKKNGHDENCKLGKLLKKVEGI